MIERVGFRGWALSKEFAGTVHNIVLRREQMYQVHRYVSTSDVWKRISPSLCDLEPRDFIASALAAGDCESIRGALRKKDVDTKVKTLLKSMQVAVRDVRGSESEIDVFRH